MIDRGGAARNEEALADARLWGLPASDIEALAAALDRSARAARFAGVWPDNRAVVDAFVASSTQWRTAIAFAGSRPRTLWIGLDYGGAAVALKARSVELDGNLMERLQIMEIAARSALNGEVF